MWDDHERALVDAYKDWLADLHSCGQPMSLSLAVAGQDPPQWQMLRYDCTACKALEEQRALAAPKDADNQPQKPNPEAWHVDRVVAWDDPLAVAASEAAAAADYAAHQEWDDDNWK